MVSHNASKKYCDRNWYRFGRNPGRPPTHAFFQCVVCDGWFLKSAGSQKRCIECKQKLEADKVKKRMATEEKQKCECETCQETGSQPPALEHEQFPYVDDALENVLFDLFNKVRDIDAAAESCPECDFTMYYYIVPDYDQGGYEFCLFSLFNNHAERDLDFMKTPKQFKIDFINLLLAVWPANPVMDVVDSGRYYSNGKHVERIKTKDVLTEYRDFLKNDNK